MHIYQIYIILIGLVLRHINNYRLFNAKSSFIYIYIYIYIYICVCIYMIWFGWVLWHINHCRLLNAKSSLHMYIKYMILYDWVLCHIINCRLFNAKSFLYIYFKYIWFALVGFYGISTTVVYLMPNPVYTYILNIYIIWFVWVSWYINHHRLFKAKSSLVR